MFLISVYFTYLREEYFWKKRKDYEFVYHNFPEECDNYGIIGKITVSRMLAAVSVYIFGTKLKVVINDRSVRLFFS